MPMRQWFRGIHPRDLALSPWTITEAVSAIGIRVRTRTISEGSARLAIAACMSMVERGLVVLPITERDYERAAEIMLEFTLGLRAGDALHIAVALGAGAGCLATLDRKMARAAETLGLRAEIAA